MLRGLKKLNLPILLGGSSNHFRLSTLQELGGWDPYNVTEGADLGIKLHRKKYKIHILKYHEALEEPPIRVGSWIKQRSRWIKGFIITYIVHMQTPKQLIADIGIKFFCALQLLILIPITIYLFSPVFWLIVINFGQWVNSFAMINFILYLSASFFTSLLSIRHRKWSSLIPYTLLMPIYNLLHSISSYRALWQLFTAPYRWDKTEHDQK